MKKILAFLYTNRSSIAVHVFFFSIFALPLAVGADTGINNPLTYTSLPQFFAKILQIVVTLGASVVVFFIIFAGFKYVTARGDTSKVEEATKTLTWTVVGAAVLLGAETIQIVITNTVKSLGN